MTAVADAGPLIVLAKLGLRRLLSPPCGPVLIPGVVHAAAQPQPLPAAATKRMGRGAGGAYTPRGPTITVSDRSGSR